MSDKAELPFSKTVVSDEEITLRKVAVDEPAKESMRRKIKAAFPAYHAERHRPDPVIQIGPKSV